MSFRSFFCLRSKYGWIRSRSTNAHRYARRACIGLWSTSIEGLVVNDITRVVRNTWYLVGMREYGSPKMEAKMNIKKRCVCVSYTSRLPCICVATNPDRVSEFCLKSWETTEPAGEYEVEETPQLPEVVLDRGSRED